MNQALQELSAMSSALKKNPSTLAAARTQLLNEEERDDKDKEFQTKIVNEYATHIRILTETHERIMNNFTQGHNCGNDFKQLGYRINIIRKYFPVISGFCSVAILPNTAMAWD